MVAPSACSTDQASSTRPAARDRLARLTALAPRPWTAVDRLESGSVPRLTLGPLKVVRSRCGASNARKSSISGVDDQPLSVIIRCALASASTRALYLAVRSATERDVLAVCENNASSCA